jgi:hypothetical protein
MLVTMAVHWMVRLAGLAAVPLVAVGCLPGPGWETVVVNNSSNARVVEAVGADPYEGTRFFALQPGQEAVVDTTGDSNAPIDKLALFDPQCRQVNEVAADFSHGATITLVDAGAQTQLGRVIDMESPPSPGWDGDFGETSCVAAAAQL